MVGRPKEDITKLQTENNKLKKEVEEGKKKLKFLEQTLNQVQEENAKRQAQRFLIFKAG